MQCGYECWDRIADAVNPGLALLALAVLTVSGAAKTYGRWQWTAVCGFGLVTVYALQWLDRVFSIWLAWRGDYSSHMAFATSIAVALAMFGRTWASFAGAVLILYTVLILHQRYHTGIDLLSSAAPVVLAVLLMHRAVTVRRGASQQASS